MDKVRFEYITLAGISIYSTRPVPIYYCASPSVPYPSKRETYTYTTRHCAQSDNNTKPIKCIGTFGARAHSGPDRTNCAAGTRFFRVYPTVTTTSIVLDESNEYNNILLSKFTYGGANNRINLNRNDLRRQCFTLCCCSSLTRCRSGFWPNATQILLPRNYRKKKNNTM